MSMLAEPRRKSRYHLTPKGKPLFEDNDRFGTKMLEKMGWSKGKGLGKTEDGTQDFVRVKFKSDERGLGFEVRDDQWTEHDKNFNGLLENLNGGTSELPEDCEIITPTVGLGFAVKSSKKNKLKDKISGQSLEENSKKSKARVHYKKFTKGKDMSQYSEQDLANIFGKKATPEDTNIYSQFQAFNAAGSDSDTKPMEAELPLVQTGVSMKDYFNAKMAALKEKNGSVSSNPFNSNVRIVNNVEVVVPSAKRRRSTDGEVSEVEEEKVPRKKKKSKSLEDEEIVSVNQVAESPVIEERVPRKKKKSKPNNDDESDSVKKIKDSEIIASETETQKQKQKCKKVTDLNDTNNANNDELYEQDPASNSEESNSSKKKKKKSKKNREEIPCILIEDDIPKKKKKKDEKKTVDVNNSEETENLSSLQEETVKESKAQTTEEKNPIHEKNIKSTISKKKKNKTKNNSTATIEAEVSSHRKDSTSLTNENTFLLDTYTISTFCAEKFRNLEPHEFKGSTLMEINGYGLSTNLELDIQEISKDAQRIIRLWSGTLDKYTHSTSQHKMYASYMQKVKQAKKTKQKIPALKTNSLKRKNVFQFV